MAKGRPADPNRAKRGTGNRPQAGQAKARELVPTALRPAIPEPPETLLQPEKDLWRRLVAELAPRGLRDHDIDGITMLCQAAQIHREAQEGLTRSGLLLKGQRGPVVNPLVKVARDQAMFILRVMNEYGFTPAARVRLGLQTLAAESMIQALNQQLDAPLDTALKVLEVTDDHK